jgi:hypothetical protein
MIDTVIGKMSPEAALEVGECLVRQALAALAADDGPDCE